MKRSQIVFVALVAMFAFGALTVESASAVTFLLALWLVKGVAVAEPLNAQAEGELTLEDRNVIVNSAVLCSGILDGTINPESLGVVSEVLTLNGVTTISLTALTEPGLECTNVRKCEEPLVWAVNLPWDTEVELVEDEGGPFFANLITAHTGGANPGWYVWCMKNAIMPQEEECTVAQGVSQLTLEGATLLASFTEAFRALVGLAAGTCSVGGAGNGVVVSDTPFGALKLVSGEELTASSETSEA